MATLQPDQEQLLHELMARVRAQSSLIAFTKFTNPTYEPAKHHHRIAAKLEAVERGEIKRLMICMPPRHGKSELASRRFPAWVLGRSPTRQVIAASYNSDLAADFGRDVRNIVAGEEFQAVFEGVSLAADSRATDRWHTKAGGMYVAAGVGTAVTGRGAHLLLIDDPVKDRVEADSETRRKVVWDWYRAVAYTRLMPGGAIVLITTRWHEDDLAGRLLEAQKAGGDQWDLLSLPAVEEGEALWPEWYPLQALEETKNAVGPREWSALYQQDPTPDDGEYFKAEWFREYEDAPEGLKVYGASDYAVTDGAGDYTVHGVFGIDVSSNVYVLDWWRGQKTSDVWIEAKCDLIKKHQPLCWFGESGPIRRSIEPFLLRRMSERSANCRIEWLSSIADKPARCRAFQAMASMGRIWLPASARWVDDVRTELLKFPAGKHDDSVDVCSLIGRGLEFVAKPKRRGLVETEWEKARRQFSVQGFGSWMG